MANWIQKIHMKKGALHSQLGMPQGKKIPAKKLAVHELEVQNSV
jgi:hypothetical protein